MNLRDVKPHTLKRMATECDEAFDRWFKVTEGKTWTYKNGVTVSTPVELKEVWREAYSKATHAILRRVDALKENS